MQSFHDEKFLPTIVIRHRKENLKKCSLRGLEFRQDFRFFTYPACELPDLSRYVLLTLDAPSLTVADSGSGLLLLDGTWRYTEKMQRYVLSRQKVVFRSLPDRWRTAYPRRQTDCPAPDRGLASVEALYAAYDILGRDTKSLLDGYHWKEDFLGINRREKEFFGEAAANSS
jgi:pre-rRNA-processing protein TSR3